MYWRRTTIRWVPAIISLVIFSILLISLLIYAFASWEIVAWIVLSPFIIFVLLWFYNWITTELDNLKK